MGRKNLVDALDFGREYVRAVNLNRPQTVNSFSTIFAVIDTSHLQSEAQTQAISISGLIQSAKDDGLIDSTVGSGQFVRKVGGDTMEGVLAITGGRTEVSGLASTLKVLNVDSAQSSDLQLRYNGNTKIYVGDTRVTTNTDVKFNKNNLSVRSYTDGTLFTLQGSGVSYEGLYTEDKHIATKKDVEEAIFNDITDVSTNKFVKRSGDSMSGTLSMEYADINFEPGNIFFQPIVPDGDPSGTRPERWSTLYSRRVRDANGNVITGSNAFGIRVDLTEGRTGYNKLELVANVDGSSTGEKFMDFGGGNTPAVRFHRGNFQMEGNRIQNLGTAEVDTDAVPYGQVRTELQELRDSLIQELSFGTWRYQSGSVTPIAGRFYASSGSGPVANADPRFVTGLTFNVEDLEGSVGAFDRIEIGEMLIIRQGGLEVKYRVNAAPVPVGSSNEARFIEVNYISRNNSFLFVDGTDWIVTLIEFENIDVDALDDTYLRLDCDNSPLVSTPGLEIKTDVDSGSGFGEAAITLNGKRDNANNSCAAVRFKNWNYSDSDEINGYITYYTNATSHFFRFNKDIDLISGVNLSFSDGGAIQHNRGNRIILDSASDGNEGSGLVVFTRPGNTGRRGVVFKGKYVNDSGTTVSDGDLLFTYTNSDIDAINYVGKIAGKHNIVNKQYVDNLNTGVLEGTLRNKGSVGNPTSAQFVPMWGSSYNSGNVTDMNRIQLHSLDGYDFRTTGSAATPGTLTVMNRGDVLWHGIIEKKSVSGDTCTIYMIKLYAKSSTWDTTSDYYFHISGFKVDMS